MCDPVSGRSDSIRGGTIHDRTSISDDNGIYTGDRWIDVDVTTLTSTILSCDEEKSLPCSCVLYVTIDLDVTSLDDDTLGTSSCWSSSESECVGSVTGVRVEVVSIRVEC